MCAHALIIMTVVRILIFGFQIVPNVEGLSSAPLRLAADNFPIAASAANLFTTCPIAGAVCATTSTANSFCGAAAQHVAAPTAGAASYNC